MTPTSLTFAAQATGTSSGAQVVTLANTGSRPLAISSIAIAGANPRDFARAGGTCPLASGTLAGRTSCSVNIVFQPTAGGTRSATLRFTDDSGAVPRSSQTTGLTGPS